TLVDGTRHWVMRDLMSDQNVAARDQRAREYVKGIQQQFSSSSPENWDDATWEAFCLQLLWMVCHDGVARTIGQVASEGAPVAVRHRDLLYQRTGQDCDERVHELLIRFCASYLDQGFADWRMPEGTGFYRSFAQLF